MFSASDVFSFIVSDEDHICGLLLPLAETLDTTLKTIVQPKYKRNCFPRMLEFTTPRHFAQDSAPILQQIVVTKQLREGHINIEMS